MKKICSGLLFASFIISLTGNAQKSVGLSAFSGTGISSFVGLGTAINSNYYRNDLAFPNAVDSIGNHFGRNLKINFLAGLQADFILSSDWVLSLNTQYEHTGSKLKTDSIFSPSGNYKTDGTYSSYYDFISINPQVGRMFRSGKVLFTFHGGFDYAIRLQFGDDFEFTDQSGKKNNIGHSGGEPEVNDCRFTLGTMLTLSKWNIDLNYKHGLTDYAMNSSEKATSRLLHLRVMYTFLNKKI